MSGFFRVIIKGSLMVGGIVGAGFATGREIAVYFGSGSVWQAVWAAICIGIMVWLMLAVARNATAQRIFARLRPLSIVALCVLTMAMLSAMWELVGASYAPVVIVSFACAVAFARRNLQLVGIINIPIVILLCVAVLYLACGEWTGGVRGVATPHTIGFFSPILYSAMNIMLAAEMCLEVGKDTTLREVRWISIFVTSVICVLLVCAVIAVYPYREQAMPLVFAANAQGIYAVYFVLLWFAVASTLVISMKRLSDNISEYCGRNYFWLLAVILFVAGTLIPFEMVVGKLYYAVSGIGLLYPSVATLCMKKPRITCSSSV